MLISLNPKVVSNLGKHFPVLASKAYRGVQLVRPTTTLFNDRRHLDRFRPCAEDQQALAFLSWAKQL